MNQFHAIRAIGVAIALAFAVTACGERNEPSPAPKTSATQPPAVPAPPPGSAKSPTGAPPTASPGASDSSSAGGASSDKAPEQK